MGLNLGRQKQERSGNGLLQTTRWSILAEDGFLVHILHKIPASIAFCFVMLTTCPIMQCSLKKCTLLIVTALLIFSARQSVQLLQHSGWRGDIIFKNRSSSLFLDWKKNSQKKKKRKRNPSYHTLPRSSESDLLARIEVWFPRYSGRA